MRAMRSRGPRSRPSADNGAIWLGPALVRRVLDRGRTPRGRPRLVVRSFTPVGFGLALLGLSQARSSIGSGGSGRSAAGLGLLASWPRSCHHEYYWMVAGPPVAVGVGRAWLVARASIAAIAAGVGLCRTGRAARLVQVGVDLADPAGVADAARGCAACGPASRPAGRARWSPPRRCSTWPTGAGCRLEFDRRRRRRAAGEWGAALDHRGRRPVGPGRVLPGRRGARYFADVAAGAGRPGLGVGLHEAIRATLADPRPRRTGPAAISSSSSLEPRLNRLPRGRRP